MLQLIALGFRIFLNNIIANSFLLLSIICRDDFVGVRCCILLFDICLSEASALDQFLPCFPPRVGLTHESSHVIEVKSLDYFIENTFLRDKNRDLSVIVSSKSVLPWQRLRLKLISDICSTLSVSRYGREFNPISDKSDGLLNYRYHIACENSPLGPSEKLWDPLLCSCVVFYAGDLRLVHPFLRKAIIPIPVNSSSKQFPC